MMRRPLRPSEETATVAPPAPAVAAVPPLAHLELLPIDGSQRQVLERLVTLLGLEELAVDEGGALGLEVSALAPSLVPGLAAVH